MARGRNINLYIRADDEALWDWAEQQAAQRRLALSQFIALVLERARDDEGDDAPGSAS
ncbi:hypothetical protein [Jiangella muralis]|uniref:hypothetical protein n=1 Tax=Jiangella muralis TaxID=702383 RepID=UPI0012FBD1BD|nr:hypothetical protein [Jiangella muralis]